MSSDRFRPSRAGIVNLWDYRDQEFVFADGRLVLRGPNGSGKTKALEVLFPFVFDGRIEPRRLNPFAGEERTMRSNVLYRGQESAHAYVWMEFTRGDAEDPEAVTVGIGMRASRGTDRVARWYFVADGRVGIDFSLLGPDDRPLTRRQLADEVGADAIVDRPVDYRAAVDARMFGLGLERYEQLIDLVLTLRRPQLAKNLDPKGLSRALSDGLRPLDDALVREAAASFSDMEDVAKVLEGLVTADDAARAFVDVYGEYVRQHAHAAADAVSARLHAVRECAAALTDATARTHEAQRTRDDSAARVARAERDLEDATARQEALRQSAAYEGKQQIDDLAQFVARREQIAQRDRARADEAAAAAAQRAEALGAATERVEQTRTALTRAVDALAGAARDAGIDWAPPSEGESALALSVRDAALARQGDVAAVRDAAATAARASTDRTRAEESAERAERDAQGADAALADAEKAVERARVDVLASLRGWLADHRDLLATLDPAATGLADDLEQAVRDAGEPDAPLPADVVERRSAPATATVRARAAAAEARSGEIASLIADLESERTRIASEQEDAPPASATRTDDRTGRPGAPLWTVVRFRDGVSDADAAGIEAALTGADLLDAWVLPPGVPVPEIRSDRLLTTAATPPAATPAADGARSLADVLEPDLDTSTGCDTSTGLDAEAVETLLRGIRLVDLASGSAGPHDRQDDGPYTIGVDGRYRFGPAVGRHTSSRAGFIGATARARRRAERIAVLDDRLAASRDDAEAAAADLAHAHDLLTRFAAAAAAVPRTGPIVAARASLREAAGAATSVHRAHATARAGVDRAVADHATALRHLRERAAVHRIAVDAESLDAVAAAITWFERCGETAARARRDADDAARDAQRAGESADDTARVAAERSEDAAAVEFELTAERARLDALRDTLGADASRVDAELERLRGTVDAAKREVRDARTAHEAAVGDIGFADGAATAARGALRSAVDEILRDSRELAAYARTDVLRIVGAVAPGEHPPVWPDDAVWPDADALAHRLEVEAATADVLPAGAQWLHDALVAATEDVRSTEATRKAIRSKLTTALQEFDASLAATGEHYSLRWDNPDGLTVVEVHGDGGAESIADFSAHIGAARSEQELLLTDAERRILEDALLTGLAQQIHERTVAAREIIAAMATEMRTRRMSSGSTVGLRWVLADTLDDEGRAVAKLLERDATMLGADELTRVRAYFASRIRAERAVHPERSYPEILRTALDYRTWRSFAFSLIDPSGEEERLTVARHSALSGGEQSVSLHLPLFAAAHVMLASADPQAPRLLALDEAFAGVDENGRTELLGLTAQFDLDLFMTGYDLWVTSPEISACAHYDLSHSNAEHAVDALLVLWTGEEMHAEYTGARDLAATLGSPGRRRVLDTAGALDIEPAVTG
ncbi:TIGR02680 family protein [Rhodococcus rhodnii]|uniref:TIGR02680 family protein n=2 Tax=Rhodococcus rhodnii TaxID=38312 RepID=R7WT11_9NOCA|nr:TIGR02680 family protein [Rhodococcus rhodnii]EOM78407.1 hypothetical protein Rrhod_0236 [Rhodococcus rhodnii LMG 5362]TXG91224.1 TIGR02680 family protein [Rhodococcus rhodnii]